MCARSFKNVLLGLDAVGEKDSFAKKKKNKKTAYSPQNRTQASNFTNSNSAF